jgi:hypothetical protein
VAALRKEQRAERDAAVAELLRALAALYPDPPPAEVEALARSRVSWADAEALVGDKADRSALVQRLQGKYAHLAHQRDAAAAAAAGVERLDAAGVDEAAIKAAQLRLDDEALRLGFPECISTSSQTSSKITWLSQPRAERG